jgi:hypothetical protein
LAFSSEKSAFEVADTHIIPEIIIETASAVQVNFFNIKSTS